MNKVWKAKWVKALRSGKFKQGHENLFDEKARSYCCLGVLAAVAGDDPREHRRKSRYNSPLGDDYLDKDYAKQFGLQMRTQEKLARMNDDLNDDFTHRFPFSKIADYIEKNL